jgi:two-component system cell cycle sensor histidine kinase/response regulator CckA
MHEGNATFAELPALTARDCEVNSVPPADSTLFESLFEHFPAPAWVFDEVTLKFVAVNDAVLRQCGYTREQFLSLSLRDVCSAENAEQIIHATTQPIEWRHRHSSGAMVTIEVTTRRITNTTRPVRLAVATEATQRKRTEGALRERDDLLRNVLTQVPCAVYWKDRASIYIGCNEQAARDHGFSVPGEVIGQTDYELFQVFSEAECVRNHDRQVIETGQPLYDVEENRTNADGSKSTYFTNRVPLRDSTGRVIGVIGVSQNVTDRKRLEEQLRHAQKMEAVGRLAGGVAHDFNNLLTVITGSVHLIRLLPAGDAGVSGYVDDIQAAVDRATNLTRHLLAFSRKQPARPEVLDLNEIVLGLSGLIGRLIGERISVKTQLAGIPIRIRADRGHIEQVLMNLAVNAKDAMQNGGTLSFVTSCDSTRRYAELRVADTGTGMTDEVRAKIFEPFFTTKEIGKGTGLGLATVHGIVEQAGGKIEVKTAVGEGTTFFIRLPWCDANISPTIITPAPVAPFTSSAGRSVLLVEDEDRIRKLVRVALEGWGYSVIEADRGEHALKLLTSERKIDLLVTDLVMPGMDGRELATQVRAKFPEVGIVLISGYTPDPRRIEGFQDAVFLPKPFTPFDLVRCAERALRNIKHAKTDTHNPPELHATQAPFPALRGDTTV